MHSCAIRKCILVCERLGKLATLYTPLKSIQAASQFCFLASCGTIELGISSGLPGGDIFCRVSAGMHRWQSSKSYDIRTFYPRLRTSMTALSRLVCIWPATGGCILWFDQNNWVHPNRNDSKSFENRITVLNWTPSKPNALSHSHAQSATLLRCNEWFNCDLQLGPHIIIYFARHS